MAHETTLISVIAGGIGLAFVFGFVAARLRLPPLVGYLLAGIVLGPFTPGYVVDTGLAGQLAEVGVILLMFGVGLHFSLADLLSVKRIAVPGAIGQIALATVLGALVGRMFGWSWGSGIVFGLCLSVASTVVLLRALEDRGALESTDGRIAVGWLIVEDLVTVVVLVLLPALAIPLGGEHRGPADRSLFAVIALTLGKVVAFVAVMLVIGRRAVPWLLERVARLGSRELFTLAVLAVALGIAVGAAALFDVSVALGAFFAGMVVNGSRLSHEAAKNALPLQDSFSVLFFVAVGMLFDPAILIDHPGKILWVLFIVMIGKSVGAFLIVRTFRYPTRTAFTISASLAEIGEFSFILATLAVSLKLLPPAGQSLVVAGSIFSIALNPFAFWFAEHAARLFEKPAKSPVKVGAEHHGHAVIVGYGRVGSAIGETFITSHVPYVVIDADEDRVDALRNEGVPVVLGDGARPEVLHQAGITHARLLVVAVPDPYQAAAIVANAHTLSPLLATVARAHGDEERAYLEERGVEIAVVGERELALGMAHHALVHMGFADSEVGDVIDSFRHAHQPAVH
ncbi:MAG TPA: YbaL family putative K(+) efflux transporter [Kofleriaceae bacterium]|nr:YbaL family putative K(+) efflux transporter [Kofleriaceae bacterium]